MLVGIGLALALVLALALAFPPVRYLPPQMPQVTPPAAPPATPSTRPGLEGVEPRPAPPPGGGLLPYRAPGPLIADRPDDDLPAPAFPLPAAPNVFEGSPAGQPSLMPLGR